jgi:hypothetical protein
MTKSEIISGLAASARALEVIGSEGGAGNMERIAEALRGALETADREQLAQLYEAIKDHDERYPRSATTLAMAQPPALALLYGAIHMALYNMAYDPAEAAR